jgi:hypothetical protein
MLTVAGRAGTLRGAQSGGSGTLVSPLTRKWIASPNYSSRGGSGVRLVVVHTAEGARTIEELGNFFASASAGVSSHVGIDDKPGILGEYVKRPDKAWTQGNANPYSVSVELCAFAAWSPDTWNKHQTMLETCAAWIAEECKHFAIPIRKLGAGQAQDGRSAGVCGHVDLGAAGGGHWDPGPAFPWSRVLDMALGGGATVTPAAPLLRAPLAALTATEGEDMAPPDYVLNDVANGSRKFAVYGSGLVRRMPGKEFQHVRDTYDVDVIEFTDKDEGDRFFQYDQALRGQVKERD